MKHDRGTKNPAPLELLDTTDDQALFPHRRDITVKPIRYAQKTRVAVVVYRNKRYFGAAGKRGTP
jgi:hypothetical protein